MKMRAMLMAGLLLSGMCAVTVMASDPTCAHGIKYGDGSVCCAATCGRCGGQHCSALPGGAADCCGGAIAKAGRSCAQHDAPCVLTSGGGGNCTLQVGVEFLGNDVAPAKPVQDESACCASCAADTACKFFTYEGGTNGLCHHKNTDAPDYSRHNATCTSGYVGTDPPTPPAPKDVVVTVGSSTFLGGDNHVCWNIDASANRGFFWRNLSAAQPKSLGAQLARQAAAIGEAQTAGFSLLRFGGSGNDYLTYEFGKTRCPPPSTYKQCLNETTWRDLLSFTAAAKAKMIFGLSMNTGEDVASDSHNGPYPYPWDPSNAREILEWTIDHQLDHLIYGFELGNEQNNKYTGVQTANDFAILYNLTVELWPDETRRPVLFGPDPHSLHGPTGSQLDWIASWLDSMAAKGVPVHAVTHHQYTEVDPSANGFTSATKLSLNGAIAAAINKTVRDHSSTARVFGGEIGPHNGGSPPCDHTSMRWAVFGDSFWYADNLAAMAKNGYSGLCRQDYIGADYGMVDCSTGAPLPDYFTALLWARTMGPNVLSSAATDKVTGKPQPPETSAMRIYAHCTNKGTAMYSDTSGGVTILAINLGDTPSTLHFPAVLGEVVHEYILTPSSDASSSLSGLEGLLSTVALLNGTPLRIEHDGSVPSMPPVIHTQAGPGGASVIAPPTSVGFFVLPNAKYAGC
jgi:heparanase 1